MLVLTRQIGEKILIGDDIEIEILNIFKNQVRIGVVAPKDVLVDRLEVRQRREQSKYKQA